MRLDLQRRTMGVEEADRRVAAVPERMPAAVRHEERFTGGDAVPASVVQDVERALQHLAGLGLLGMAMDIGAASRVCGDLHLHVATAGLFCRGDDLCRDPEQRTEIEDLACRRAHRTALLARPLGRYGLSLTIPVWRLARKEASDPLAADVSGIRYPEVNSRFIALT